MQIRFNRKFFCLWRKFRFKIIQFCPSFWSPDGPTFPKGAVSTEMSRFPNPCVPFFPDWFLRSWSQRKRISLSSKFLVFLISDCCWLGKSKLCDQCWFASILELDFFRNYMHLSFCQIVSQDIENYIRVFACRKTSMLFFVLESWETKKECKKWFSSYANSNFSVITDFNFCIRVLIECFSHLMKKSVRTFSFLSPVWHSEYSQF